MGGIASGIGLVSQVAGLFGGSGSSSSSGGGPTAQQFADAAFQHHEGTIAARQFGAQQGVGNSTGSVMAQNANDLQFQVALAGLNQDQQIAALNASNAAQNANGLLNGLGQFGTNTGNFGNTSTSPSSDVGAGGTGGLSGA